MLKPEEEKPEKRKTMLVFTCTFYPACTTYSLSQSSACVCLMMHSIEPATKLPQLELVN